MLFVVSLPAVTTRLYSSDEVQYFSYLRSLYFDGDVSFENEYRYFVDHNIAQSAGFHETFLVRETRIGRRVNYATMGAAVLWLPFYAAADVWNRATGSAEANGFTRPYIAAVAYGSAFYGFLAVLLSARAATLILGHSRRRNTGGDRSHRRNTEETQSASGHSGNTEETLTTAGHSGNTEETQTATGHSGITPEARKPSGAAPSLASPDSRISSSVSQAPNSASGPTSPETRTPSPESRAPFLSTLAIWLGTPLLFYMYVAPPFSHACSAFAVALFVNVWLHVRREWTPMGAVALGLSAALVAMVREQDAFLAIAPALDYLRTAVLGDRRGAAIRAGVAGLGGFVAGYAPQLLAYTALNGYPGPAEHVSRKMYWYAPHALEVLGSPHHGFLFWTPLALLAIIGLFLLKDRWIAACLLIMVASQVYVAGSVDSWTVAGAFGQRRFVCVTVLLVIGLAAVWERVATRAPGGHGLRSRRAVAVAALAVLCIWWNVALMAQFATRLMDRQRLEPVRNAYHAFVTLPLTLPSLAYRYLTDRASFYDQVGRTP